MSSSESLLAVPSDILDASLLFVYLVFVFLGEHVVEWAEVGEANRIRGGTSAMYRGIGDRTW
jgi:hypothetical protein